MLRIAHRGSTQGKILDSRGNIIYYKLPENSMQSYINAIQENFDMIEADIILTKDNQLIMFHDIHIGSQYTYNLNYIEIQKKYPHVPTFSQFCTEIPPKTKIILDIKGDNNTALKLVEFFKKAQIDLSNFYFSSFDRNHLMTIYNYNKNLKLGIIYNGVLLDQEKELIINLLNLKFVSICWKNLNKKEIEFYKKREIQVFTWTNTTFITKRLIPTNVDGIISDYIF